VRDSTDLEKLSDAVAAVRRSLMRVAGTTEEEDERAIYQAALNGAPLVLSLSIEPGCIVLVDGKIYFHDARDRDRFSQRLIDAWNGARRG
jgi:hypothetical protein